MEIDDIITRQCNTEAVSQARPISKSNCKAYKQGLAFEQASHFFGWPRPKITITTTQPAPRGLWEAIDSVWNIPWLEFPIWFSMIQRQIMFETTDYGRPMKPFFIKIFWGILGRFISTHFGTFGPSFPLIKNYFHKSLYCQIQIVLFGIGIWICPAKNYVAI